MPRKTERMTELRRVRLSRGLDQVEAGRRVGVSGSVFGRLERGTLVRPELFLKALRALKSQRASPKSRTRFGALLRASLDTRGLSLSDCEDQFGQSRYYWSVYTRDNLVSETGKPMELSPPIERRVTSFIEATVKTC